MKFVNDLSPFVFAVEVGGREIGLRWYGLAYLLGFAFGYLALRRAAMDGRIPGMGRDQLDRLAFALVLGVVGGGRMGYVVQNTDVWFQDPLFPLRIWEGGMAFFGGLLGVALALVWSARRDGLPLCPLADALAIPAAIGTALGRIANFANRELWGRPTGQDWGVIYPNVDQQLRHPAELYSSASLFLIAAFLWWLRRRWGPDARPGLLAAAFLMAYGLTRVATDFFREEPIVFAGLDAGQIASLVAAAWGWGLWLRWTRTAPPAR